MSDKAIKPIVLASTSPRRRQLLAEAGYRSIVVAPSFDESSVQPHGLSAEQFARTLALAKAKSVYTQYPDHIVLAADTVVDAQGQIIGKPADAREAECIIRRLFAGAHKVITAIALLRWTDQLELLASDTTIVYPRPLTDSAIRQHIRSGVWRGKAGAYAIRAQDDPFVERIEGSLTNVMGLPVELLQRLLDKVPALG